MSFTVPEADAPAEAFEFTVPGRDGVFHMTPISELPLGIVTDLADESRTMIGLIAAAVDDDSRDALRSLKGKQVSALMQAWKSAAGITPGESSAS
jgi:hypothetical protein